MCLFTHALRMIVDRRCVRPFLKYNLEIRFISSYHRVCMYVCLYIT